MIKCGIVASLVAAALGGANALVATIADTPGVEGVEYVPELKKVYTACTRQSRRRAANPSPGW